MKAHVSSCANCGEPFDPELINDGYCELCNPGLDPFVAEPEYNVLDAAVLALGDDENV